MAFEPATPSPGKVQGAAVLVIAATYIYFLIFAEFALLELVHAKVPDGVWQAGCLAALVAGGVAGSLWAAARFSAARSGRALGHAFRACVLAAGLTWLAATPLVLGLAALAVGAAMGNLTVTLAAMLRGAVGERRLGRAIGWGTGLAYAFCNLPWIFSAAPSVQALLAAILALVATRFAPLLPTPDLAPASGPEQSRAVRVTWFVSLLALVWFDSAAFYTIQHTAILKQATWAGAVLLCGNALVHLGAAVLSGWALDRGAAGRVLAAAGGLLALACALLPWATTWAVAAAARWSYVAGVSLYSVALVYYPAKSGRPWLGAALYIVAGWAGSALGIGMAQDLHGVPPAFIIAAVVALGLALGWRGRCLRRMAGVCVSVGLALSGLRAESDSVALGREVYIAEGCIHCHSQYVRPGVTADIERWGPARELAVQLAEQPPLFGNRRQGPDLLSVGNRRSPEWNRLHLLAPATITPGSRMPSYVHLFADGDERGPALVEYLAGLGRETLPERLAFTAAWVPKEAAWSASAASGRGWFERLCSGCHGLEGRGDGPLASQLSLRPPDFTREAWRRLPAGLAPGERDRMLARLVKFGVPGTPMAGHEYLDDQAVVALVRYVTTLHTAPTP